MKKLPENAEPRKMKVEPTSCDRLTSQLYLVQESCGFEAVGDRVSLDRLLSTTGMQPWVRRVMLDKEITVGSLMCWIPDELVGVIAIISHAGAQQGVTPTDEEKKRLAGQVVEINDGDHYISPKGFFCGETRRLSTMRLRAENGPFPITIRVHPR